VAGVGGERKADRGGSSADEYEYIDIRGKRNMGIPEQMSGALLEPSEWDDIGGPEEPMSLVDT
jgi:hypothetical protein